MIIIFDLNNNSNKKVFYLFNTIFGFNKLRSQMICSKLGVDPNYKVGNLPNSFWDNFQSLLVHKLKYVSDNELKKYVYDSILLKKTIKSYQGIRHLYSLPVNGQKTRTNAKTMKWKKKKK